MRDGRVIFRLEDGRMLDLAPGKPQLRHVDRAWASTVHAFQGRTVDTVIAAMEALEAVEPERAKGREAGLDGGRSPGRERDACESRERAPEPEMEQARVPKGTERDMAL